MTRIAHTNADGSLTLTEDERTLTIPADAEDRDEQIAGFFTEVEEE